MSNNYTLFPMIGEDIKQELGYSIKPLTFSFDYNGEKKIITSEKRENIITLSDELNMWNPNDYNLIIEVELEVNNLNALFGISGVASNASELGIGLCYYSKPSNRRKSFVIDKFNIRKKNLKKTFTFSISKSMVREIINIDIVVFLSQSKNEKNEAFASTSGTVLGILSEYVIQIEGIGSEFTVFEVAKKGFPLWTIDCDWVDPNIDKFSDSVKITINSLHPAFLLFENELYKKEILKEIMATAMQLVIMKLSLSDLEMQEDYETGSVTQAISYIINKASIEIDSVENIATNLRKYLDSVMR